MPYQFYEYECSLNANFFQHSSESKLNITSPPQSNTHFLSRKPKLKMRKTIVMTIPQVARIQSINVAAMCTVTISSSGTPSYGIPSTDRQENGQHVLVSFQAIQRDLRMRPKYVFTVETVC